MVPLICLFCCKYDFIILNVTFIVQTLNVFVLNIVLVRTYTEYMCKVMFRTHIFIFRENAVVFRINTAMIMIDTILLKTQTVIFQIYTVIFRNKESHSKLYKLWHTDKQVK